MRVYLSGPITDIPQGNRPLFESETARLRALGYDVVNPWELNPAEDADWMDCMLVDLPAVKSCHAIALLPGWIFSNGAQMEYITARKYGLVVLHAADIVEEVAA